MKKSNITRWSLKGSAAVLALAGAFTAAQAYETKFGEVSITFDTTVSMGASMLTADRNTEFLPEANGGAVDPRESGPGTAIPFLAFGGDTGANYYTANAPNFDGSLNGDDGRLNFDRGDLIGANVKATHDLIVGFQNYKLFARATGFYDVIMNDEDVGDHSQLTDQALGDVGRNYDLLDLFVSADYTVADLPVNLRVGKQVINWGESTFIQNGLNAFNPIDVAAIRKPGSEIKEALVPVNAAFASVSFPFQVSMSGWYALDWEPFEIDPSGTPFSTTDVVALGSGVGGNQMYSFVTSSPFGSNRRTCNAAVGSGTAFVQSVGLLNDPNVGVHGDNLLQCGDSIWVDSLQALPVNQHELIRLGQVTGTGGQVDLRTDGASIGTTGVLFRGEDYQARDGGQYGLKATWFAEELNGTEFGFYYQNYHSRLPFVTIETRPGAVAQLGFNLNSRNTDPGSVSTRGLPLAGCGLAESPLSGTPLAPTAASGAGDITAILTGYGALTTLLPAAQAKMQATAVNDPGLLLTAANAYIQSLGGPLATRNLGAVNGVGAFQANQLAVAQLNCVLAYYQGGAVAGLAPYSLGQTADGAEFLLGSGTGQTSVVYPEDIEQFGLSFNTTIGSWGVQGEVSYRPNAPFQVDTDSLTIAALVSGCVFQQTFGATAALIEAQATPGGDGVKSFCGDSVSSAQAQNNALIRNEMFTGQIGTTSQFTGSDWFIELLGADIGTMVTELGMVYTPGVEDTWIDNLSAATGYNTVQYQNTGCQGTDLPVGGILSLDRKASSQCRPTNLSAGLVMLFTWSYNNFLDTGYSVSPRIVYSFDFEGTTAAPYGNYMEDRQALNLGIDGSLNNNFKVGVSYSNFFGGHVTNKSSDRDFASVTASYSF